MKNRLGLWLITTIWKMSPNFLTWEVFSTGTAIWIAGCFQKEKDYIQRKIGSTFKEEVIELLHYMDRKPDYEEDGKEVSGKLQDVVLEKNVKD